MLAPSKLAPAAPARGPAPVLSTSPLVAAASVPATPPPFKWCVFAERRESGDGTGRCFWRSFFYFRRSQSLRDFDSCINQ